MDVNKDYLMTKIIKTDDGDEYISKTYNVEKVKSLEDRTLEFVISDENVDADNERIMLDGWNLKKLYNGNLTFGHNFHGFSYAKAIRVWVDKANKKLMGRFKFAGPEVSSEADTLYKLYKGGYMKAVSPGFKAIRDNMTFGRTPNQPRITYNGQYLFEVSMVAVGSNQNALSVTKAFNQAIEDKVVDDLEVNELKLFIEKSIDANSGINEEQINTKGDDTDDIIEEIEDENLNKSLIDIDEDQNQNNKDKEDNIMDLDVKKITDEITNSVMKAFEDRQKVVADEAAQKAIKDENVILKAELDTIKKAPAGNLNFLKGSGIEVGEPDVYKGYNFHKQGSAMPKLLNLSEKDEVIAKKGIIDAIAPYSKNPNVQKAILTTGTALFGAELIKESWFDGIVLKAHELSYALSDCRRFPITTGNTMHIPAQGTSATFTAAAETAALTESEPGTADIDITAVKYGLYGRLTQEMVDDPLSDIYSYITYDSINALGQTMDNLVFNGGTGFSGVLENAANTVTFGTSNTATNYSDMVSANWDAAKFGVSKARGRMGAKFYMARDLMTYVVNLKLGETDFPYFNTATNQLAGFPVAEVEAISGTDTTAAQYYALFGSLMNYALGIRTFSQGIEINDKGGTTEWAADTILYKFRVRICGAPIFADHFVSLITAAG